MMLSIKDLHTFYGKIHALKGVDLEIEQGEIVTLVGSNGAGKSTLLASITGIVPAAQGSITFQGKSIFNLPPHKIVELGISMSPEGREIFPALTVQENLRLGAYTRRDREGITRAYQRVYALFPRLKERIGQTAGTLSGGEQQMLAIGRALMTEPKLLMFDEPSMGLAPLVVKDIFSLIHRIRDEMNMTILLVEQNAKQALKMADRGYILETGEISMTGPASDLLASDHVRAAYLGGL